MKTRFLKINILFILFGGAYVNTFDGDYVRLSCSLLRSSCFLELFKSTQPSQGPVIMWLFVQMIIMKWLKCY